MDDDEFFIFSFNIHYYTFHSMIPKLKFHEVFQDNIKTISNLNGHFVN